MPRASNIGFGNSEKSAHFLTHGISERDITDTKFGEGKQLYKGFGEETVVPKFQTENNIYTRPLHSRIFTRMTESNVIL